MATPSGLPPPSLPLKLDSTIGTAFIGNIVAVLLYGLTTLQVYVFFSRDKRDTIILRSLIIILWFLDTAHAALITHAVYFYTITNYNNPVALLHVPSTIGVHTIIAGLSDVIVRSIFTYRVWKLSGHNIPLIVSICFLTLLAFLGSPALTAVIIKFPVISEIHNYAWLVYATFISAALVDILIASSLSVILWRKRTGFKRTDSVIRVLMIYTINTGAFASAVAVLSVVTFAVMPNNFVYFALFFVLPKLLLNSLLATLNARQSLRQTRPGELVSIQLANVGSSSESNGSGVEHSSENAVLEVQVEKSSYQKVDISAV